MRGYEITKERDIMTFKSDHGECYGGVRTTHIDCANKKKGKGLYKHLKAFLGSELAKAAKGQGWC